MEFIHNSKESDTSSLQHCSFFDCLPSLMEKSDLSPRATEVIQMRIKGMSLDEVGKYYNMTRERIRQIEAKAMAILTKKGNSNFKEDEYSYLFSTYDINKNFFIDFLNVPEKVWYYLNMRYFPGENNLSKAINDSKLSADLKQIIEKYISKNPVVTQTPNKKTNPVLNKEDRILNAIRLWCLSEGYEEALNTEDICFIKEGKITNFIIECDKSKEDLLTCIRTAKSRYDYIYVVINDSSRYRELAKIIPDFCGIFCDSNAFGNGNVTQIFREAK